MNRLNELADRLEQAMGGVTVKEIVALLRAAAAEQVGTEWTCPTEDAMRTRPSTTYSPFTWFNSIRDEHNSDLQAARLAVAAARRERDEARAERDDNASMYLLAKDERDEASSARQRAMSLYDKAADKNAALQRAIDEAVRIYDKWAERGGFGPPINEIFGILRTASRKPQASCSGCGTTQGIDQELAAMAEACWCPSCSPHATRREGTKAERQWSSTPPQDRSGKWWNAWKNTDGSHGVRLVPLSIDWRDALDQKGTTYDLWLLYLDGDTRDTLPPLTNSSAPLTGSPVPTRELVARLAKAIKDWASLPEPEMHSCVPDVDAIIRDARRGGAE